MWLPFFDMMYVELISRGIFFSLEYVCLDV